MCTVLLMIHSQFFSLLFKQYCFHQFCRHSNVQVETWCFSLIFFSTLVQFTNHAGKWMRTALMVLNYSPFYSYYFKQYCFINVVVDFVVIVMYQSEIKFCSLYWIEIQEKLANYVFQAILIDQWWRFQRESVQCLQMCFLFQSRK